MNILVAEDNIIKGANRPDIPIIGLTTEAFRQRHAHFREIGMKDVLPKPFTEQQLKGAIAQNFNLKSNQSHNSYNLNKRAQFDCTKAQGIDTQDRTILKQRGPISGSVDIIADIVQADTGEVPKKCT